VKPHGILNLAGRSPYIISVAQGGIVGNRENHDRSRHLKGVNDRQVAPERIRAEGALDISELGSSGEIFSAVYDELRNIAHRLFARERPGHTLQPTALVHEAYLKLVDQKRADIKSRTHVIAIGAQAMRRLLVDHARRRGAAKRGSARPNIELLEVIDSAAGRELDLDQILSVNNALEQLARFDQRQALIVTLRFFGGLNVEEVAEVIGMSVGTVARDWRHARAWLQVEIARKQV
jgi:RNA polymerase sigma factor (TIGR02999 family)